MSTRKSKGQAQISKHEVGAERISMIKSTNVVHMNMRKSTGQAQMNKMRST